MATRKYEVLHPIRIERRKSLKRGAVVELEADQAYEWAHALKILPEEVQDSTTGGASTQRQAPQAQEPEKAVEDQEPHVGTPPARSDDDPEEGSRPEAGKISDGAVSVQEDSESEKPNITESARAEADRLGISLDHVRATGAGNTLTMKDVQREAKRLREERGE